MDIPNPQKMSKGSARLTRCAGKYLCCLPASHCQTHHGMPVLPGPAARPLAEAHRLYLPSPRAVAQSPWHESGGRGRIASQAASAARADGKFELEYTGMPLLASDPSRRRSRIMSSNSLKLLPVT